MTTSYPECTHAVPGAPRAAGIGRRSLVALAGLIVAVTLVWGLGGAITSAAAAATPSYAWATKGGGTGNDQTRGVSALPDGSSIITGFFRDTATFGATTFASAGSNDTFTAKVNANGTYAWAIRGGGPGLDQANGVSALPDGSSIITGYFDGTAIFGATSLISAGLDDAFTVKVNADGTYAWATRGGGTSADYAYGVSALPDGSSITTGYFNSTTATFGATSLISAGGADTFTARILADAPQAPTGASASAPVNTFTMKRSKIWPQKITTQLNLPGPGKVVQVGTTPLPKPRASSEMAKKARRMTVCTARKTVAKAGKVTITCRLNAKARAARKTHSLKVRLVTTFTPTGGTAKSLSKTLVLKKTR